MMKKNEQLLDAIGEVNEVHVPDLPEAKPKRNILHWITFGGSICAALLIGVFAWTHRDVTTPPDISSESSSGESENSKPEQSSPDTPDRKPLTDEEYNHLLEEHRIYPTINDMESENTELVPIASDIVFDGLGFEGYMVHDISELDTINPWSAEKPLETLPVFKNLALKDNCNVPVYLSQEQMEEMANDAAYCLGMEVTGTTVERISDISYNPPEDVADLPYCVEAVCDGENIGAGIAEIRVFGDGTMSIRFNNGLRLPDGYSFTDDNTTDSQAIEVMEYLTEEFKGLLQFENPAVYSYADRNVDGGQIRNYCVYGKYEDYKQDMLSYNFTNTEFGSDGSGKLMMIWLNNPLAAAENIGEYPIIDAQEATQCLLSGNYITTVPAEYLINGEITADAIAKTELIYRIGERDEYYQPYYKFYVALSDEYYVEGSRPEKMKEYGAFYVPAIAEEYIDPATYWDGSNGQ